MARFAAEIGLDNPVDLGIVRAARTLVAARAQAEAMRPSGTPCTLAGFRCLGTCSRALSVPHQDSCSCRDRPACPLARLSSTAIPSAWSFPRLLPADAAGFTDKYLPGSLRLDGRFETASMSTCRRWACEPNRRTTDGSSGGATKGTRSPADTCAATHAGNARRGATASRRGLGARSLDARGLPLPRPDGPPLGRAVATRPSHRDPSETRPLGCSPRSAYSQTQAAPLTLTISNGHPTCSRSCSRTSGPCL